MPYLNMKKLVTARLRLNRRPHSALIMNNENGKPDLRPEKRASRV
jgi:hypothetical protein